MYDDRLRRAGSSSKIVIPRPKAEGPLPGSKKVPRCARDDTGALPPRQALHHVVELVEVGDLEREQGVLAAASQAERRFQAQRLLDAFLQYARVGGLFTCGGCGALLPGTWL